ncbi:MAG: hypothetical protein IJW20_01455 [Clostridia bacterium]|nr:hypothetical protein [Clostridia bacterium]
MKKKKIRKSEKWNKGRMFSKLRDYHFENPNDTKRIQRKLEKEEYQNFLRNKNKGIENVSYKHLEDVFTNEIYYEAMKKLPLIEKQALFVAVFESSDLEKACSDMKMTKKEVIEIKTKAINHFKDNVKKEIEKKSKRNGGASNE